jgi:tol-pal system protein YbgF
MTSIVWRSITMAAVAAMTAAAVFAAAAQDAPRPPGNLLDRIFRGGERTPDAVPQERRPADGSELMMRIERLEAQIRQLTGAIEELQHRNQQLEAYLRRQQDEPGARPMPSTGRPLSQPQVQPATPAQPVHPAQPGRRGDAFDPAQNPNAPGAPRMLGSLPGNGVPPASQDGNEPQPHGAPGGREAGAPLDLSTLAGRIANNPGQRPPGTTNEGLPPPPPRNPSSTGTQLATLPPSDSPKDTFDLAYGYILRKDYALAEEGFRRFLAQFPGDRMTPDAEYWLGESLFQRQRYRDAAEAFLNVSTKYETTGKAPDALLRLGQSLAGLGEKEAACASLAEVLRKYPRASVAIRQGVEREQKRVRC